MKPSWSNLARSVSYLWIAISGYADYVFITTRGLPREEAYADLWWNFVGSVFFFMAVAIMRRHND